MKLSLPVLALVMATGLPLAACAQQSSAAENGPPPEIRAQMQAARDSAKTAAFNDLSAGSRAKVQAIVDQVNNGQLTDLRAAAQQIDAALTPAETKAVLAERDKLMQTMRANMPPRDGAMSGPNAPPPNGPPPNGPNGGPNNADHPRGMGHKDVGSFLLRLAVSPEKMRQLHQMQQKPAGQ
ncbi:MAG: hypothetical protein M3169_15255 [Candidatus Eremiobacteraeota bacterium]|nr:hypothetical protein [Candidatus Eremiobacteraeota bacterium]